MEIYKVLTATQPNQLQEQLNAPENIAYEIASVTGSFELSYTVGGPETGVTVILKLSQAAQNEQAPKTAFVPVVIG